jgi:antitoxin MazE
MLTKVQRWGNSQGLRVPKTVLEEAHVDVGDQVNVSVRDGKILIEPVKKIRGKYNLKNLVSKMPKQYRVEEASWGPAVGKEEW